MEIAVLGAGIWGTALAVTMANNHPSKRVWFWGRSDYTPNSHNINLPNNICFTTDLNLILENCRNLLITVSSNGFIDLIKQIIAKLNQANIHEYRIAWATKGMDSVSNRFFSEIILDYFGDHLPIAILSGPSFAQEVLKQIPTAVTLAFASKDQDFANYLFNKLNSKNFKIYFSNDLIGVELSGIYKNILAVATGICDGIGFGANTRSALITKGLTEILSLIEKLHADPKTLLGLAGIGDIILTCCNDQSRNRRFGLLLAQGNTIPQAKMKIGQAIEALDNIETLYNLSKLHNVEMPVVFAIRRILQLESPVYKEIDLLL